MQNCSKDRKKYLIFSGLLFLSVSFISACTRGGDDTPAAQSKTSIAAPPANFSAVSGDKQVTLVWDPVTEAKTYNLYWSLQSAMTKENSQVLADVSSGYVHEALSNAQAYYYFVTAVNAGGESLASAQVMAIPGERLIADTFPDVNLKHCVSKHTHNDSRLNVSAVNGALDCSFRGIKDISGLEHASSLQQLDLSNNSIKKIDALLNLESLTDIDLSHNDLGPENQDVIDKLLRFPELVYLALDGNSRLSCDYLAALINTTGLLDVAETQAGDNCTVYKPLPAPVDPLVPVNVKAIAGNEKVTLVWNPVIDAGAYNVYWATSPGVALESANRVQGVQSLYVHDGLSNRNTYYYKVTAVINSVESQPSDEVLAVPDDTGIPIAGLFTDQQLQLCLDETAVTKGWTFAHEVAGALDCSSRSIQSLEGVENLVEISSLNLINNSITDISPLSALANLKRLYLSNNMIVDLDPLASLPALTFLNLRNNGISDVSAISNSVKLTQLYLTDNRIRNVSAIAGLTRLRTLDMRNNALGSGGAGDIALLASLQNATSILLAGNIDIACEELISLIESMAPGVIDLDTSDISCDIPPRTPGGFQLMAGHERVIVNFEAVVEADSYRLYWSLTPGVNMAGANRIDNVRPGYQHAGLNNGTRYYYVLTALNGAGESVSTDELSTSPSRIPISGLFTDNNLQACIDALAAINNWNTADEVTGVVNCSEKGISDLSGIEHLASISSLSLNGNVINDVSHIGFLINLKSLSLYNNNIIDVQALGKLTSLTDLFLNQNSLNNAGPLSSLAQLQALDISNNKLGVNSIGNVDELSALANATMINLSGNAQMSCLELDTLINALTPGVLDITGIDEGRNCANPSLIPAGVRAVAGNAQITLSWYPVKNVTGYHIYWSTTPGVDVTTGNQITVQGNRFVHEGLINDTVYYYTVTSHQAGLQSKPSAELSAVPSANGITLPGLFSDAQLRDCVNSVASVNGWTFAHELTGTLNCSARQINHLNGIEFLTELNVLRLGGNNIQDISALGSLTKLIFLDLFNNTVSDISSIATLTNLRTLYLHNNNISDITPLSSLAVLDYLILDENRVSDVSPLSGLSGLSRLFLRANDLSVVNGVSSLTQLQELYINNNSIVDVSPLSGMAFLQQLDLRNNAIGGQGMGNIDSLAALTSVSKIRLNGNANISCAELDTLTRILGPNSTDLGEAQAGVNCQDP